MYKARDMYRHFSNVAPNYRHIRTTDHEPIEFIAESLNGLHEVKAAEVDVMTCCCLSTWQTCI